MARIVAYVPDLLFGSNVVGMLNAAGHEVALVPDLSADALGGADALVVDLTADASGRIEAVRRLHMRPRTLAFYSHVEADVRVAAESAGIDLVVPRSRMAREGAALLERLIGGGG
jgi:hypothetical protein